MSGRGSEQTEEASKKQNVEVEATRKQEAERAATAAVDLEREHAATEIQRIARGRAVRAKKKSPQQAVAFGDTQVQAQAQGLLLVLERIILV